jgi:PAS domain S-box-containing protein
MSGPYAYTPYIWPSVLTVLLLVALSIYAWRRRSVPGALPFAIAGLFDALWMAGYTLVLAATDAAAKIFWLKFGVVWQAFGATAVTCFLLEYAWPGRWLTRRNLALLSIPPLLIMGLILTNDLHHLMWRGFVVDGLGVTTLVGPAGWIAVAYGVGLVLVNLVVFAWLFVRSPQHRWPVALMLTGQIAGRVAYVAHVGEAIQSELLLNVLGVAFLFVIYALALFGFRMFDPIAMARQMFIEQLHTGMLVLDPQGRVISLNAGAGRILGRPVGELKGRRMSDLLPAYPDRPLDGTEQTEIELCLPEAHSRKGDGVGAGPAVRHYALAITPLQDWRGLEVGRLLLLRDVTAQKQAQARLVEQQRVMATLEERERLARELHDSAGQMLGYVSMQAQAIRKWVQEGQAAEAEAQLTRLADAAQEAHADIRESIFSLKGGPAHEWSFLATLRQHLDSFQDHYGIRTELTIPAGLTDQTFEPVITVQLLRVIQEAMTNARKHGRARCVRVVFERADSHARILVADDGRGFDPGHLAADEGDHLGLAFMRERMAQVNGCMTIESRPGEGTEVVFEVPIVDSGQWAVNSEQ